MKFFSDLLTSYNRKYAADMKVKSGDIIHKNNI